MSVTKTNILESVDDKSLFDYYLKPYHQHPTLRQGQNISNPFLNYKQETPSFNIFNCKGTTHWRYFDFATGDSGDVFDLIMNLKKIDFKECLELINTDLHLNLT